MAVLLAGCGAGAPGHPSTTAKRGGVVGYIATGNSMLPTIRAGESVVVEPNAYARSAPETDDVVAFHPPTDAAAQPPICGVRHDPQEVCPAPGGGESQDLLIRRIVAGPGDTITISDGHVIRNGRPESGLTLEPCGSGDGCRFAAAYTVPANDYFLVGDNRGSSDDSRFWGPVPRSWIVGKVVGVVAGSGH